MIAYYQCATVTKSEAELVGLASCRSLYPEGNMNAHAFCLGSVDIVLEERRKGEYFSAGTLVNGASVEEPDHYLSPPVLLHFGG